MEQIVVYKKNGTSFNLMRKDPSCTVTTAVQNLSYMSDDYVQLTIKSTEELNFSYGDKIIVYGREYWLRSEVSVERSGEDLFVYDAQFMGVLYELLKSQYRNTDVNGYAPSSAFDLTGTLLDFIRLIPFNTDRDFAGLWTFDEASCPETEALTLSFSKENCLAVLQRIVKEFDQEFVVEQENGIRIIKIGKFGQIINPPSGNAYFEYGKGKGLYNLKLQKVDDQSMITRLWIEGGTNNIKSDYRGYSQRLQLPLSKIGNENKRYVEDTELKQKLGDSIEDTEFFDEIFPKRLGSVTGIATDILSFFDTTMDFDLNEKDSQGNTKWLIDGVSAKIIFNSGALAGQEFELSKYDHSTKKFTIIEFTDSRGLKFPNPDSEAFRIRETDTYKITDITLPDQYVTNAENELWDAAIEKLNDRKQPRVQYVQTFDKTYFSKYLPTDAIANVFIPGDFVPVKDDRLGVEKNIQIQKVTRNILADYDYTVQLSDITAISIFNQTITDVIDHERVIESNRLRDYNKARRGWRTTEELRTMVYDTDGYFDAENIKPNSIDTNMLSVGAKSQQFILEGIILQANFNGVANAFNASSGTLVHLAIEDTIRSWNLSGISYSMTNSGGYYVFAKCSKVANTGVFIVTQTRYMVENTEDPNNYYFQVGIIGSLTDGFRDFTTTYGFTRINGNTITTGRIITSDGECYLDLDGNKFRIGDSTSSIDWNVTAQKQLTLRNVKVLSGSGDLSGIGVFRGAYASNIVYYKDDEVTYNGATYRYINNTPYSGKLPTDLGYWSVVAAKGDTGTNGTDGAYFEYRYAKNGSTTSPPSLSTTSAIPSGWTTTMPSLSTLEYMWCTIAKKSASGTLVQNWSTPTRVTGADGAKGDKGDQGDKGDKGESPAMVYRGVYDSSKVYYGTSTRVDAVLYNGVYYVARIDAGNGFTGRVPTNTTYWNTFGAQFESIATNLLLAENANIADWIIKSGKITSQNTTTDGTPRAQMDGANGGISFASDITRYTASGESTTAKQTISLDSQLGEIESRSNYETSYMNSQGIFTNRAGIQALPSSTGVELKAAIVALGNGDLQKTAYDNLGAICGVYGVASNSNANPAPAWGGYFNKLLAKGLYFGNRQINASTWLNSSDCYVSAYNAATINVYLPSSPQKGQLILVRRMDSSTVTVQGNGISIHVDGNLVSSKNAGEGRGDTGIFIYDGQYWNYNYWVR